MRKFKISCCETEQVRKKNCWICLRLNRVFYNTIRHWDDPKTTTPRPLCGICDFYLERGALQLSFWRSQFLYISSSENSLTSVVRQINQSNEEAGQYFVTFYKHLDDYSY